MTLLNNKTFFPKKLFPIRAIPGEYQVEIKSGKSKSKGTISVRKDPNLNSDK